MNQWQLQEAKNKLSQVIDEAVQNGPQTITRHGKPTVVVLSIDDYEKDQQSKGSLVDFLMNSPWRGVTIDVERDADLGRDIEL